jgi:nucleotide-binding universal stress UspA family protein
MSYATLMVHVDADGQMGGRVRVAAGLADLFDASLIGIAAWAPMSVVLGERAREEPTPAETHLQDMKALLDQKGQQFRAAVGTGGRRVEWRSVLDFPTGAIAREARAADLVIIGNVRENLDPFRALDPAGLLLKAGRPALVVPGNVGTLSPKRVAIAWKDAREARRAVRDALPFLQKAESVMVVEISEDGSGEEQPLLRLKDVAGYLARHGVKIVVERVRSADYTAADALLRLIHDENINLIVAGAYGHSRLGEWAYGGITGGLLAESPICCLFSH